MYYCTLNTNEEAKAISLALLERHLAVCTHWFPINCAYRWQGEIKQEGEVVIIIKTKEGMRPQIEAVFAEHITYLNYIAELNVESVNSGYLKWLDLEVPAKAQ